MLRLLSLTLLFGLLAGTVHAAETHPFSVHDMLAMDRISDPRVSPDGKVVAFAVSVTDLEKNKRRSDLYLAAVDGSWVRRLTTHDAGDTQPRWSRDGKSIYFVSTRSGSSQVWRIAVDGGEARAGDEPPARRGRAGGRARPAASWCSPWRSSRARPPTETKAAPRREGEVARPPGCSSTGSSCATGTRGRTARATTCSPTTLPGGPAKDLMGPMDADCPTKPFGGSKDYSISPDGKTIVFSAKDVGREEAWSTNFDLFAVPADGSVSPRRLTTNPAADSAAQVLARRKDPGLPRDEPPRLRGGPLRDRAARLGRRHRAQDHPARRRLSERRPLPERTRVDAGRQGAVLHRRAPGAERRSSRWTWPRTGHASWWARARAATRRRAPAAGSSTP